MWSTRPLPFADPDTWQRLRAVIDTVWQWKASVVQIGGRLCWPLWRGVHELDEVLTCFHRRPAGARGAGYCAGQETPTADATAWGCRFVRGVDLEAWGHRHAPWYHFGQLTDDHTRFVAVSAASGYAVRYAARDPSRPVGITRTGGDRDLAVSVRLPLDGDGTSRPCAMPTWRAKRPPCRRSATCANCR